MGFDPLYEVKVLVTSVQELWFKMQAFPFFIGTNKVVKIDMQNS